MKQTITDLLKMQGALDQLVLENLPEEPQSSDFRSERAIAMVCEFLEGADGSLEERADFLHFILSYALEWGLGTNDIHPDGFVESPHNRSAGEIQKDTMLALSELLNLHEREWKFWKRRHRIPTYEKVALLCRRLMYNCFDANRQCGHTIDQLVEAYKVKNAENVRRQQTGY